MGCILNTTLQDRFSGNLMVVGSANRTATLESPQAVFQQVADASNIPIIGPILQGSGEIFPLPALVAISVALLLVVSVLWIIKVVRRKILPPAVKEIDDGEEDER